MSRVWPQCLLPPRQYALFSQARCPRYRATNRLGLTLTVATTAMLYSYALATTRSPISMFEVDRALQTSRVVIRGKIIGGRPVGFSPAELHPGTSPLRPGKAYFPAFSVKVEKVLSGWYWGDEIEVVLMDQYDHLQCKMEDEVVVCANFSKSTHCFVMPSAGFLVKGEQGKWELRSSYVLHQIPYTTREIKDLTKDRKVMK